MTDIHWSPESGLFVSFEAPSMSSGTGVGRDGHLVRLNDDGAVLDHWTFPGAPVVSIAGSRGPVEVSVLSSDTTNDLNGDSTIDAGDIELLTQAVRSRSEDTDRFDVNADGLIDEADRRFFIRAVGNTYFGDANWDGAFDTSDLIEVLQAGEFEDDIAGNSVWSTGDWDGDGDFGARDLLKALQSGSYEAFKAPAVATVPEPHGMTLALTSFLGLLSLGRYRRCLARDLSRSGKKCR